MSPQLDPSKTYPVQVPVAFSFLSGLWGFSTALKYTLTCSTLCLVSTGGRSSINFMVSVGVSSVFLTKVFFKVLLLLFVSFKSKKASSFNSCKTHIFDK